MGTALSELDSHSQWRQLQADDYTKARGTRSSSSMPVATRAAAAALHEASQTDLLDLVLANALALLHQRDVCALLCTSRAAAAAVERNSSGS